MSRGVQLSISLLVLMASCTTREDVNTDNAEGSAVPPQAAEMAHSLARPVVRCRARCTLKHSLVRGTGAARHGMDADLEM
jgi:hypothetical protein